MSNLPRIVDNKIHGRTGYKTCAGDCPCGSGPCWVCGCSKCHNRARIQGKSGISTRREGGDPRLGWPSYRRYPQRGRKNQTPPSVGGIGGRQDFSVIVYNLTVSTQSKVQKTTQDNKDSELATLMMIHCIIEKEEKPTTMRTMRMPTFDARHIPPP